MERISVNFLPKEIAEKGKQKLRKIIIVRSSVVILIAMILVTVGLLSLVITQQVIVSSKQAQLETVKTKLTAFGPKESLVLTLRNRIEAITKINGSPSLQVQAYLLMLALTPPEVNVTHFSLDRDAMKLSGETRNVDVLETFFNRLLDPTENEGKITSVALDGLGLSGGGQIRFDLTLTLSSKALTGVEQ